MSTEYMAPEMEGFIQCYNIRCPHLKNNTQNSSKGGKAKTVVVRVGKPRKEVISGISKSRIHLN